jgi:hypothetical protein
MHAMMQQKFKEKIIKETIQKGNLLKKGKKNTMVDS